MPFCKARPGLPSRPFGGAFATDEDRSLQQAFQTARLRNQLCVVMAHRGARKSTTLTRLYWRQRLWSLIIIVKCRADLWDTLRIGTIDNATGSKRIGRKAQEFFFSFVISFIAGMVMWFCNGVKKGEEAPWKRTPTWEDTGSEHPHGQSF